MRQRYPNEMTIVLQHQFWNLSVRDDEFEVKLSFNDIPERLVIPFRAVKGFLDAIGPVWAAVRDGERRDRRLAGRGSCPEGPTYRLWRPVPEATESAQPSEPAPKIVSLDAFRKK